MFGLAKYVFYWQSHCTILYIFPLPDLPTWRGKSKPLLRGGWLALGCDSSLLELALSPTETTFLLSFPSCHPSWFFHSSSPERTQKIAEKGTAISESTPRKT